MDRLSDSVGLKHIVLPINWLLTHPPIPHAGQIRNLPCVIINIFHLLVSKIWALRLKFQNVTKIGSFNPYYFPTGLLELLCDWPVSCPFPVQFTLNVLQGKKVWRAIVSWLKKFQSLPIFHRIRLILSCHSKLSDTTPQLALSSILAILRSFFGDFNLKTECSDHSFEQVPSLKCLPPQRSSSWKSGYSWKPTSETTSLNLTRSPSSL